MAEDETVAGGDEAHFPQTTGASNQRPAIETVPVDIPIHRYRVLFSDGVVVDFLAGRDDSNLREHMRITHWGAKGPDSVKAKDGVTRAIVGVTDLGEELVYTPDATAPPA